MLFLFRSLNNALSRLPRRHPNLKWTRKALIEVKTTHRMHANAAAKRGRQ